MSDLIPFLVFAFISTFTPGPNNFMILNSGLHFGIRKSLPHYLGICFGFPIMVFFVALGLGAIFLKYALIKQILKIVGAAYMLYLAYGILRSHNESNNLHTKMPLTFLQASLFQWVNPKAWIIAIGTISLYTLVNQYVLNAFLIAFLYFLVGLPCIGSWLWFGKTLKTLLKKPSHRALFNLGMAIALVGSIGMIFVD